MGNQIAVDLERHAGCRKHYPHGWAIPLALLIILLLSSATSALAELGFTMTYAGQQTRTWNWSDGSRDRITLNAAGTVVVRPHQVTTTDGQSFLSYTADLATTNHVWGT